jgi:RNA polymerase primary sigma factor
MTKMVEAEKVRKAYRGFKDQLSPREKEVITRYYGIDEQVRHSLAEIAGMYQVTRERIRQIKVDALRKLKMKK